MGQRLKHCFTYYLEGLLLIGAAGRSLFNFDAWRDILEKEAGLHE